MQNSNFGEFEICTNFKLSKIEKKRFFFKNQGNEGHPLGRGILPGMPLSQKETKTLRAVLSSMLKVDDSQVNTVLEVLGPNLDSLTGTGPRAGSHGGKKNSNNARAWQKYLW